MKTLLTLIFLLTASIAHAETILTWNHSPEPDLFSYTVYHDGVPEDITNITMFTSSFNCGTYTLTATDISGNESGHSEPATVADWNNDGVVNLWDFNIFRVGFRTVFSLKHFNRWRECYR